MANADTISLFRIAEYVVWENSVFQNNFYLVFKTQFGYQSVSIGEGGGKEKRNHRVPILLEFSRKLIFSLSDKDAPTCKRTWLFSKKIEIR